MYDERYAMHWRRHGGWHRRGHPGFFFFPPFVLVFGFFLLFMLFHTGLWIPLLVAGLIFWGMRQHQRDLWEKPKHEDWEPEKPKHDDYDYI